jgi:uncharacterized membrane protein HdeD (DUF308 family)
MAKFIVKYWKVFVSRGIVAVIFGFLLLLWPGLTLRVLIFIISLFAVVGGLLLLIPIFDEILTGKAWWFNLSEGIVCMLLGVITFLGSSIGAMLWPKVAERTLVLYFSGWAMLVGMLEILTATSFRSEIKRGWTLLSMGVLSIVFAFIGILVHQKGALALTWFIGIYGLIYGALLIHFGMGSRKKEDIDPATGL